MSGKKKMSVAAKQALAEYRLRRLEQEREWRESPPELEVRSVEHAASGEVLEFCLEHLRQGRAWNELRYRLGIPHGLDPRWRVVKSKCIDILLPKSDEEALSHSMANRAFLLQRVEKLVDEIEAKSEASEALGDMQSLILWTKMKMDAFSLLLAEAKKDLDEYAEMQKLKKLDAKHTGPSIIVQNNFHIPRPKTDSVRDVLPLVNKLSDFKAVLDEGGGAELRANGSSEGSSRESSAVHHRGGGDGLGEESGDS
jgi:hypothetical protein